MARRPPLALIKPGRRHADIRDMLVARFPVVVGVLLGVAFAVTGAFVFSLPLLRPPIDETMLAPSHLTVQDVRAAFRAEGIRLRHGTRVSARLAMLGVARPPWSNRQLYVYVGASATRPLARGGYEARVGDVLVHDGGTNVAVLARVKRAVAALRG